MAEIQNLTELKAEIDVRAKRTLGAKADKFISLAEKRIVRSFAKSGLMNKLIAKKTLVASSGTISLPRGCRAVEVMYLDTNPKQVLGYRSPADFFSRYLSSQTNKPRNYTLQGNVIHLGPTPDDTYNVECWFRQDLDISRTLDQVLIPDQTEADYSASFTAGSGHAVGDVITLASGRAQVTVEAVSGGAVTQFTVTEIDHTDLVDTGETLSQSATTGSGTGFDITLDADNISNLVLLDHPELYLCGALIEHYLDTRNAAQKAEMENEFYTAVDQLEEEAFNMGGAMQIYVQQASAGAPANRR